MSYPYLLASKRALDSNRGSQSVQAATKLSAGEAKILQASWYRDKVVARRRIAARWMVWGLGKAARFALIALTVLALAYLLFLLAGFLLSQINELMNKNGDNPVVLPSVQNELVTNPEPLILKSEPQLNSLKKQASP